MRRLVLASISFGTILGLTFTFAAFISQSEDCLITLVFAILFGIFAFKKKTLKPYFIGLAIGISVALLLSIGNCFYEGDRVGVVIQARENYFIFQCLEGRYYVYLKNSPYEVGDILKIDGSGEALSFATYESRFNFLEYLKDSGVKAYLEVNEIEDLYLTFYRPLGKMLSFIGHFEVNSGALLMSLILGIKDYDSSLIANADSLGCLYFLSSSGFYYALVLSLVEKVAELFSAKHAKKIALAFGAIFLPLGILKASIYRVFFINLYRLLNKKRNNDAREKTLLTLLALNPYYALSSSFITGFVISYGLSFASFLFKRHKRHKDVVSFILLGAFLLPSFSSGYEIHFLSFIYSSVLTPLLFPYLLVGGLSYVINIPFVGLLNGYAAFLDNVLIFFKSFDVTLPFIDISNWYLLYYAAIFILFYLLEIGFYYYLKRGLLGLFSLLILLSLPLDRYISAEVTFINVGQGDSIFVRVGGHTLLVDTGGNLSFDMADEVLIPFFRKKKVYSLDYLVLSHNDFDHAGAKDSLMENFKVGQVITKHEELPLRLGDTWISSLNEGGYHDENDDSLVLKFTINSCSFLLTGDIGYKVESDLIAKNIDLNADILKLPHHGSNGSSSLEFLKAVSPKEAVISVGANNYYGHPSDEVLKRLEELDIKTRRTDKEGSVNYCFYGFYFS